MNTYEVFCVRKPGATSPVRSVTFRIDADTPDIAEGIAAARLARMRDFPGADELEIDSTHEVTL